MGLPHMPPLREVTAGGNIMPKKQVDQVTFEEIRSLHKKIGWLKQTQGTLTSSRKDGNPWKP
jgi:hypothetical protein